MTYQSASALRRDGNESQRLAARHKLFEPMTMQIEGARIRVHLLDLSLSGALAHAEDPPVSGARVAVENRGALLPARVIWVRGKRFGLQFDRLLSQTVVDELVGAPRCAVLSVAGAIS